MRVCSEGGRAEVQGCARVLCRNPQARVAGKSTPALRDGGSQRALQYAKGLSKYANSRASGWRTKCRTQRMRASKLTLSLLVALLTPACQASLGSSDAGMRTDARGTDATVSLSDAPGVDAPGIDAPVAAEDAFIPPGTDAYIPACTANCAGRVCGDDGCGGSCGSCAGTCTAAGLCEPPPDVCPRSDALGGHVFPSTWREGQCLFIWNRSDLPESGRPVIRAHFDCSALYASAHYADGRVEFAGADLLGNMGLPVEQIFNFCRTPPSGGTCDRYSRPTCAGIRSLANCQVLFGWDCGGCPGQGRLVRLRVGNDGTIWTDHQHDDRTTWGPVPGGNALQMGTWPVAIEPYSELCFGEPTESPPCP